jgi:tRNA(Ile2) C34 agmatinyltransferase TiaS
VLRVSQCHREDDVRMSTPDDGTSGGGDGVAPDPLAVDPFEDGSLDTPNCPSCLHRMEPAATAAGAVYWSCPNCGQTRLT